ncbi:MAG TPA: MBL fold metallo-hydrolase [Sphaerochaeta sp.]|nr:MBL fold metallo-hydrolase [Sphaerochaeta sp.]
MKPFRVTFLGTGTSHGIPVIGCPCPVCHSSDPHDKRFRSSILIDDGMHTLLIDTTPEFRLQALRANLTSLDAVLYTHDHADHFNGIDDLRVFCKESTLPVFCSDDVVSSITSRFGYVLKTYDEAGGIPHLQLNRLVPYQMVTIAGFEVLPIPIRHGCKLIMAFRIGSFIYATDSSGIPPESLPYFEGVDTLVLGSLRYKTHPTHFSVGEATAFATKVGAKRVFLTHLCHDIRHSKLEAELPSHMHVAYDMLKITIGDKYDQ